MANSDKDLVITPNKGSTTNDPKIVFSGASSTLGPQNITLQVYPTNNGTLSFEGSAGQLFSITNSLSGTIFSVNDVSGIPSFEVIDTGLVKVAQYGGNVLIGTGTDNGTNKLQVNGSISGTAFTSSISTGTAPFTVSSTTKVSNLNADLLDGLDVHTGTNNEANKIVRTDGNGYIQAGWINTISGDNGTTAIDRVYASGDGYIRYYTPTNFRTVLDVPTRTGGNASGTWGIDITGNAATATSADNIDGRAFSNTGSNSGVNADTLASNGISYYTSGVVNFSGNSTDGALYSQAYSSDWQHQIAGDYREGNIAVRGKNSGTWARWKSIPTIAISDTAPANETPGDMWWESDTGKLKIYYNDGSSSQWVDAVPIPDLTTYYSKAGGAISGPVTVNSSLTTTGIIYADAGITLAQNTVAGSTSVSPGLLITNSDIRSAASSTWTGDPGTQGKIQYHSNRWYIVADSSSDRIVQFRRNASDVSYVDNSGNYVGNVTGNVSGSSASITGTSTAAIPSSALGSGTANSTTYLRGDRTWQTVSAGATLSNDTSTNSNGYYPAMATATSGSWTTAYVSSTKLYFNPSTGTLNATVFNSLSDQTLKDNIQVIDNSQDILEKIHGVSFNWRDSGQRSYGVIAQEIEQVLPDIVSTRETGEKSVNYSALTAFLIEQVKHQQQQIDLLIDRLAKLGV